MRSPLFSVIIPTFNRIHLLGDTISNVLQQTYTQWELIIVDDGSTDHIGELIASYNDSRISFHAFEHSANYAVARNRGLRLSHGELIAFLDSDDIWSPDKLARMVEVFDADMDSNFILHNVELIGNTTIESPDMPNRHETSLFEDLIHERKIVFYPSALAFRREVLSSLVELNPNLSTGADHDFMLRMASRFSGTFINERLTRIRKHESNTSSKGLIDIYADSIAHVKRFYDAGRLTKTDYASLTAGYYYKLGLTLLRQNDKRASAYFKESIKTMPMQPKAWVRYLQSKFVRTDLTIK